MRREYILQEVDVCKLITKHVMINGNVPDGFEVYKILKPTDQDPFFRIFLSDGEPTSPPIPLKPVHCKV